MTKDEMRSSIERLMQVELQLKNEIDYLYKEFCITNFKSDEDTKFDESLSKHSDEIITTNASVKKDSFIEEMTQKIKETFAADIPDIIEKDSNNVTADKPIKYEENRKESKFYNSKFINFEEDYTNSSLEKKQNRIDINKFNDDFIVESDLIEEDIVEENENKKDDFNKFNDGIEIANDIINEMDRDREQHNGRVDNHFHKYVDRRNNYKNNKFRFRNNDNKNV